MVVKIKLTPNKKMSIKNRILKLKKPDYVYIPLTNYDNLKCSCLVKEGDFVYKGTVIGMRDDHFHLPIHSSVSGKVKGIVEKLYLNGEKVSCVKIENDYKEKLDPVILKAKSPKRWTKKEFIARLKDCGVVGMGGSGFPTYVKYDVDVPIKTIVVNGAEGEPYITTDYVLMREKAEEILECLDLIMEIMSAKEGFIVIEKGQEALKNEFNKYMGTYPNIKILLSPPLFRSGWEGYLMRHLLKLNYHRLPSEKGVIVNNVSTIYAIYEALQYHKPVMEKMITITGESVKKPQNIIVKIGTDIKDILTFIGGYHDQADIKLIAGGPMMGQAISSDDLVVSNNLNGIVIMPNKTNNPYINCMRCGKCVDICPVNLAPVLIKNAIDDKTRLQYLEPRRCIECGLCSYICPSKVDVREYVKVAKEKVVK